MKLKVLIAEDESAVREILALLFKMWGHDVVEAADTDAALAALDRESFDLVWTDEIMPGEGGGAVLRRSKEKDPSRPVIVGSGTANESDYLKAGADEVMPKPFDPKQVHRLVDRLARESAARKAVDAPVSLADIYRIQEQAENTFRIADNETETNRAFLAYAKLMQALNDTVPGELQIPPDMVPRLPETTSIGPAARAIYRKVVTFLQEYRHRRQ